MSEQRYLAVDLGAESGRVIAGLFDGKSLRLKELHRFSNGPINVAGSLRWDLLHLWSEIQTGLGHAAQQYGASPLSVGVDTWGVDYVLLSKSGELLGLPYCYRDVRTDGVMDAALSHVPREQVFATTGLQFMPINTLYQLIAFSKTNRNLLDLADSFLMIPDYLHYLLSGSRVAEFTNATTSQCLNATTRQWATDLLRRFDIPTGMFPEIVAPGTVLGRLRSDLGERTGLGRINVTAPPTHDTAAAVVGAPTQLTGTGNWAYISSGTWSLMGLELPTAILSSTALRRNVTNEGGVDGTYRLLKNIMGLWLVQGCRRSFEKHRRLYDYGSLTEMAAQSTPFVTLFNPDAPEFLAPECMASAISDWCRQHREHVPSSDGAFVRAALESLALKYRAVLGWLEELSGQRVEVIHIVGGGTQNELLNQFTANACNRPVVTGPIEATAMGNVLTQARAAGEIGSLAEIRQVVRESIVAKTYEPQDVEAWSAAYARFCHNAG